MSDDEVSDVSSELNDVEVKRFNIPILWIICDELKENIHNITRKLLVHHYTKCKVCEINNNNDHGCVDFNQNIKFNYSSDETEIDIILKHYQRARPYIESVETCCKYEYDDEKIVMIYYTSYEQLYDGCIFILIK